MKRLSRTRRLVAASAVLVTTAALTACSGGGGDDADSDAPIQVTMPNHVYTELAREFIPEFEEETGISVELTTYGEDQLSDQYNVKLNSGSDEIDVMMFRPAQEGRLFAQNVWLSDLGEYADASDDWDRDDFQEAPLGSVTIDDQLIGVPIITEREVLYYRGDLLDAAGLEVPTTLEELETAAQTIQEQNPGIAGFVSRGARAPSVTQFSSYLYSFGGDWVDEDGAAAVDSDEAKEAYEYYGRMLREYGPEGATSLNWPEAMGIFTQGNAAFYTEADSLYKNATDPENSTIVDSVRFAQFPEGPDGSKPYNIPSWALGLNDASGNKDSAWTFIEWMTSKEQVQRFQEGGVPGARTSVWENPDALAGFPEDLAEAIVSSIEVGVGHDRPQVVRVGEARDIVGTPIVTAIEGGDVDEAADKAASDFQSLLEDDE